MKTNITGPMLADLEGFDIGQPRRVKLHGTRLALLSRELVTEHEMYHWLSPSGRQVVATAKLVRSVYTRRLELLEGGAEAVGCRGALAEPAPPPGAPPCICGTRLVGGTLGRSSKCKAHGEAKAMMTGPGTCPVCGEWYEIRTTTGHCHDCKAGRL